MENNDTVAVAFSSAAGVLRTLSIATGGGTVSVLSATGAVDFAKPDGIVGAGNLKKQQADLAHVQYIIPPGAPCPVITTIHDVAFRRFPERIEPIEHAKGLKYTNAGGRTLKGCVVGRTDRAGMAVTTESCSRRRTWSLGRASRGDYARSGYRPVFPRLRPASSRTRTKDARTWP